MEERRESSVRRAPGFIRLVDAGPQAYARQTPQVPKPRVSQNACLSRASPVSSTKSKNATHELQDQAPSKQSACGCVRHWLAPLVMAAFVAAKPGSSAAAYPEEVLENKTLNVRYYLPDGQKGYYRGTRFDWSGLISRIDYAGTPFSASSSRSTTAESRRHLRNRGGVRNQRAGRLRGSGAGRAVPQVGDRPAGEARCGRLQFCQAHKIAREGIWEAREGENRVDFLQNFTGSGGWGYSYVKSLVIDPELPVLTIRRSLQNTGQRAIETDHYGTTSSRLTACPRAGLHA